MGLVIVIGCSLFFILGIILSFILKKEIQGILLFILCCLFGCLFVLILTIISINIHLPISEYPNGANITMDGNYVIIYFSDFTKDDDKVIIDNYCRYPPTWHWDDFYGYDVINTPLTIIINNKDNQFFYENRLEGGIENNQASDNTATQP